MNKPPSKRGAYLKAEPPPRPAVIGDNLPPGKEPRPETRVLVCQPYPFKKLKQFFPPHWAEEFSRRRFECCRQVDNHMVEAHKSHPREKAPDIYIWRCNCGRKHIRFCVGRVGIDKRGRHHTRPFWTVR